MSVFPNFCSLELRRIVEGLVLCVNYLHLILFENSGDTYEYLSDVGVVVE